MQHIIFQNADSYDVALLIKSTALIKPKLEEHYLNYLSTKGVKPKQVIGFDLLCGPKNKCPVKLQKAYLEDLLPILKEQGVSVLAVADAAYFKTLTKERKAEPHYGYVLPCAISGYEHMKVVLLPNYQGLFYNPDLQDKITMGLDTIASYMNGNYQELGANIIHSYRYVYNPNEVFSVLQDLKQYDKLTVDTETLSLKFWETGIVTIAFAWDKHNGVTIWCDDYENPNSQVRQMLKDFFFTYTGTLIYHNANFDMKIIINTLFMQNLLDEVGKQEGIEVLTRNFEDTKLITYLATNSTTGNNLSLKYQAHEFAGNYAQDDIDDIRKISKEELVEYNLVDCLSTWYVYEKHYDNMVKDDQLDVYETIFKPSVRVILQMELTGMPVYMPNVKKARKRLERDIKNSEVYFKNHPVIQNFVYCLREEECNKVNAKLKTKVRPLSDFDYIEFNPNSNPQMQKLFYEHIGFPVIDKTDTGAPACGADTLRKLINHTEDDSIKQVIEEIINWLDANKILGTFIKAFEGAVKKDDGHWYLHGNFNLGGTVSGRLSSSGPNMQNIPSTGNKYAKLVKMCFAAPPGWVFMGADFASLEDRISALTTKDPNKLKVYTDGFDGHCLRAYYYFKDKMPDIDPGSVESINSIAEKYKALRQKSKTPTFALTYGGTWIAIVQQTGLPENEAKAIEKNYHEMYVVSDEWVKEKIDQAAIDGFVTVAFGLRVRTPKIKQSLMNTKRTPYEAIAEGRTAGNALGQSYGMLNNRAGIDLQERCFDSDYRYDILPVAHIHDAQYFLVRDDIDTVKWLNDNLVQCMEWQELPEIQHPEVGLGGNLSLFFPTWAEEVELPNFVEPDEIKTTIQIGLQKQEEEKQAA